MAEKHYCNRFNTDFIQIKKKKSKKVSLLKNPHTVGNIYFWCIYINSTLVAGPIDSNLDSVTLSNLFNLT